MAPKAKQTISLEALKELAKVHLKEPNVAVYMADDVNVVVQAHLPFFLACSPLTARLNPVSLKLMAVDVFQLAKREADLYGTALASAYSHCMIAGSKAKTGEKLSQAVRAVYNAASKGVKLEPPAKQAVKTELMPCKDEPSSPRPHKVLKSMPMDSPRQIAALYSGSSSSSGFKQESDVKAEPDVDDLPARLRRLYSLEPHVNVKKEKQEEVKEEKEPHVIVKKENKEEVKEDAKPICTVDVKTMTCKRLNDGVVVPLTAGPAQLLIADFGSYVHTTEMSNLMLLAKPKPICKRPAAKDAPTAAPAVPNVPPAVPAPNIAALYGQVPIAPAPDAQERDDYRVEWYKKGTTIGIRAKFGKKNQVLSFGGTWVTKSEAQMKEIAKGIIKDLHGGMSYADAKAKGNRLAEG